MKKIKNISYLIILLTNFYYPQQLIWKHLGGPMGGFIGDIGINSNGEIFAGAYNTTLINYSGLYKSTDNGETWNKIETQFDDFAVYSIYITEEDHIWVGTNFQGRIYRSTDNGLTWENKREGYNTGECWAFGKSSEGVLFSGDAQYSSIYRSTDYGDNWELSVNLSPLVFASGPENILYAGTITGLFGTCDNGLNWAQNNFLNNMPVSSILIDNAHNIYCGTGYPPFNGNGVYFSSDGGKNWEHLGLSGKVILSLAFDSNGNLYAGSQYDGLFKTTNKGKNWIQYQEGLYRKNVFRIKINKQDNIFIGSENEGVFRYKEINNKFEQIGLPISRVQNFIFSGDSLIFTATPSGVQRYNKFLRKWQNVGLQKVEAVTITDDNVLFAATFDNGLHKSDDLGDKWELTNLTADTLMSVYNVLAINNDTIFASTEFNLRYTTNKGISWNIIPIKTGFFSRCLSYNNNTVWVSGLGFLNDVLYKSSNGFHFDSVFSGFFTQPENNLLFVTDNNYVFIGDSFLRGINRSSNNGLSFEQVLFNKNILSVFADNNGIVFAGSDSIFFSEDYGSNWSAIPQPLERDNFVSDIKRDINNKFYFGTYRTGLYEIDLITGIDEDSYNLNKEYKLEQNFPNPFNQLTSIKYTIPNTALAKIVVYDILGSEIKTLVNEMKPAGYYETTFDGSNLSSGIYIYRITAMNGERILFSKSKQMLLIK